MPSILFVCTANLFRSPIAALSFRRAIERNQPAGEWVVESAGTWTKDGLSPQSFTVKIANRLGLQGLEHHLTRQVNIEMMEQFDLIIVMETGHKEALCSEFRSLQKRVFLLSEMADGIPYNIADPTNPDINPNDVANEIDRLINKGFNKIIQCIISIIGG